MEGIWPRREWSDGSRRLATGAGLVLIALYLGALTYSMQRLGYETWGALLLAPALVVVPSAVFMRLARRDPDPRMIPLMQYAVCVKLIGCAARYVVAYYVYGSSDATAYHQVGRRVAESFHQGDFRVTRTIGSSGTWFIGQVTGWLYSFTGASRIIAFLVFAWFGFAGLYLFYRAFALACPQGDHHRYAMLLFFLPSLVYWPASLGKDAWMLLGLGVTAYGFARLLTFRRWAVPVIAAGLWATAAVRPHITLIAVLALVTGLVLRPSRSSYKLPAKIAGLIVILFVAMLAVSRAEGVFGLDTLTSESTESVLDEAGRRTSQGNSAFTNHRVRTPADLPIAAVTVLFRPIPIEVRNAQGAVSSMEGLILLGICLKSSRQLRAVPRRFHRWPYIAAAVTFTIFFIVAFSVINNFGILARQRVQVYPFLLALLCVPVAEHVTERPSRRRA